MRQLKFRIWNRNTKMWIHGPKNEVHLFGEVILTGNFMNGVGIDYLNDCEAMQFTGFIDCSDNEIYEGDIVVEKHDGGEGEANIGQISFVTGTYAIDGVGPLYDQIESNNPEKILDYIVVGNIFENPELLQNN